MTADKKAAMDALKQRCIKNLKCPLRETATQVVFGDGDPNAQLMFIGEAPGEQEDKQGIPFVGPAGKYLDRLLAKVGLTRSQVYIANILKLRPPNNRNPHPNEIKEHTPWLLDQIRIIRPRIVIALGNFAAKFALAGFTTVGQSKVAGITSTHGTFQQVAIDGGSLHSIVFPVFHPAAVLHNPDYRAGLEADFDVLGEWVQKHLRIPAAATASSFTSQAASSTSLPSASTSMASQSCDPSPPTAPLSPSRPVHSPLLPPTTPTTPKSSASRFQRASAALRKCASPLAAAAPASASTSDDDATEEEDMRQLREMEVLERTHKQRECCSTPAAPMDTPAHAPPIPSPSEAASTPPVLSPSVKRDTEGTTATPTAATSQAAESTKQADEPSKEGGG